MNVLICTPTKFKSSASIQAIDEVFSYSEHLGIAYLAAVLRESGYPVQVLHSEAENLDVDGLRDWMQGKHFDLIGLNTDTPSWQTARQDLREIRQAFPEAVIVVGGPHANALHKVDRLGDMFRESGDFDLAAFGEGEYTLLEIAQRQAAGQELLTVLGTASRSGTEVKVNPARPLVENIDTIPFPAIDLLPLHKYSRTPSSYRREPVRSILAARGCPFSCLFCDRGAFGRTVRLRSVDNLMAEVDLLVTKYGARELRFWDDVLTINEARTLQVCEALSKYDLTWSCNGRVKMLTDRMLAAMKKAGCWEIDLGIEAGNDTVLRTIHKGFTAVQAQETIKKVSDHGIEVRCFFILGFPGETRETVADTINFALNNPIDYATFYLPQAYPGTELYEIAVREGALGADYSNYLITGSIPSYTNPNIPPGELADMQRSAYRRFYRRPSYIWKRLKAIRSVEDIRRYWKALAVLKM